MAGGIKVTFDPDHLNCCLSVEPYLCLLSAMTEEQTQRLLLPKPLPALLVLPEKKVFMAVKNLEITIC